jgi:hypothetical protein
VTVVNANAGLSSAKIAPPATARSAYSMQVCRSPIARASANARSPRSIRDPTSSAERSFFTALHLHTGEREELGEDHA